MRTLSHDWYDFTSRAEWKSAGINNAKLLTHQSIAKWNSDVSPYLIPNEWICGRLASFLGLPIPPFALSRTGVQGRRYFASLRYGKSQEALPDDTIPTVVFQKHPDPCTGILLFDILVANADRHSGNLQVDSPTDPKRLWMIDHDRALFGGMKGDAKKRLRELLDRLGMSGGSVTTQNRHCLLDVIDTAKYIMGWIERIRSIPRWFILDACMGIIGIGINKGTARLAFQFLEHRKINMQALIRNNRVEFRNIGDWGLLP